MGSGAKTTVTGLQELMVGIRDAFDDRQLAAHNLALEMAHKALMQFRQRQMSQPQIDDGRAKADSNAAKNKAIQYAQKHQANAPEKTSMGDPWTNRSFRAARSVYADAAANTDEGVYFSLYHTMSYGVYLELANNRKHAVLEPIVRGLSGEFLERLKRIYAGGA